MKTKSIAIVSGLHNQEIENKIKAESIRLKLLAEKNGRHFGAEDRPDLKGDSLEHYTGEIKAGCEKLSAEVHQYLQPAALFPEAKIEADFYREKDANLDDEIAKKTDQNRNDSHQLDSFKTDHISLRVRWAFISTFILTIGDVIYNTKSFQLTSENLLLALILSIVVSFGVFLFSHLVPLWFKEAKVKWQKILIVVGSLVIATVLFIALAVLRSTYLATNDVHVHPVYFVIINMFFFIVSGLLSYFLLPSWEELKQNSHRLQLLKDIKNRNKEIELLKKEKADIRIKVLAETKNKIRISQLANYYGEIIRKLYWECIAIFKTTNLGCRPDQSTPECFSENLSEPDINQITFNLLNATRKS